MKGQLLDRKALMKDLRSSHFMLGTDDTSKSKSEYKIEYNERPIAIDHDFGEKLGLKKSHFNVGQEDIKDLYKSMYKNSYVPFPDSQPSKLEEHLKKDLRRHHWELGNEPTTKQSEAKEHFVPLELPKGTREEMLQVKQRNKQENLHFADDGNYFSSVYTEKHNKNLDPNKPQGGFNRDELKKHLTELRTSHIMFGAEGNDFGTSMRNNFTNKSSIYEKAGPPMDLMKTNYYPGDDIPPTESMYKHFHHKHPIEPATLNEALKKDLRAHHFKYGDTSTNYETENKAGYKEYDMKGFGKNADNPLLWQNHFHFGDDKPEMKSFYKSEYVQLPVKPIVLHNDTKRDRSSNIVLGYDKNQLKSEAASNFKDFGGVFKSQLEAGLKADLRKSHFKFEDPIEYQSLAHATYTNLLDQSKKINTQGVFKELAGDLRKNHFDYGTDPSQYTTTMRDGFKGIKGKPSDLEKELKNDLRRNHFEYGTSKQLNDQTSYKTDFTWKKADPSAI